jgi:hypothetical protein
MSDNKTTSKNTGETPLYLRIQNFTITQSLHDKLTLFPAKIQERLAFVQSLVIYSAKKARHSAMFVNISATTLQRKYHDYKKAITLLVSLGELEINESYKVGRNTMSYRIPQSKLASGTTTFSAKIKRVRKIDDKTIPATKSIAHQQKCFQKLQVRDVFISTGDKVRDEIARRELLNVRFGAANIRKGRSVNREFNTILSIPKDARINLAHVDGLPLCEFDFKSCHPFLLINYCEGQERADYAKLMCDPAIDIYEHVATQTGAKIGRDKVKIQMLRYLNGGKSRMFEQFYSKNFPRLNRFIKSGGKSNAKLLQDFESSIMEVLGEWCAGRGLFYIQQHDGYLSTSTDGACIAQRLEDIVFERLGVRPVVKAKELRSSEEITNNYDNNTTTIKDRTSSDEGIPRESIVSIKELPSPEVVQYQDTYSMEDELAATLTLF